jgi:hypothetical protein
VWLISGVGKPYFSILKFAIQTVVINLQSCAAKLGVNGFFNQKKQGKLAMSERGFTLLGGGFIAVNEAVGFAHPFKQCVHTGRVRLGDVVEFVGLVLVGP